MYVRTVHQYKCAKCTCFNYITKEATEYPVTEWDGFKCWNCLHIEIFDYEDFQFNYESKLQQFLTQDQIDMHKRNGWVVPDNMRSLVEQYAYLAEGKEHP